MLDPAHSQVGFTVQHLALTPVNGTFGGVDTTIRMPSGDPASVTVKTVIDVASIETGDDTRDQHLLSADFFDVEQFPAMTFESTRTEKIGESKYKLFGNLTIKGVTKEVGLVADYTGKVRDSAGNYRHGFQIFGGIDRRDFGLTWNKVLETGGFLIGDQVKLAIVAEVVE